MSERGSKIARIRKYFQEGDIDEVQVVRTLINQDVDRRIPAVPAPAVAPKPRRRRRSRQMTIDEVASATTPLASRASAAGE